MLDLALIMLFCVLGVIMGIATGILYYDPQYLDYALQAKKLILE